MTRTWPIDEYQQPPADAIAPPQPAVTVPGEVVASTLQTRNLLDEFFRLHAPTYASSPGCRPGTPPRANHLVDSIGLNAARLAYARNDSEPD